MAGSRARSPSPSDHTPSKRARYDDRYDRDGERDRDRERDRSSRSSRYVDDDRRHRDDRHRPSSSRHKESSRSSRRDKERERDLSPVGSVSSDRSKNRHHRSDKDRSGRDRDRDADRDRDRDRDSRRERDRDRDRRDRDEDGRHSTRDREREREGDGRNGDASTPSRTARDGERTSKSREEPTSSRRQEEVSREKSAQLAVNGSSRPEEKDASTKAVSAPKETPEQKKQREMEEKKKRLEAWKAQKAAQKAASTPAGAASPSIPETKSFIDGNATSKIAAAPTPAASKPAPAPPSTKAASKPALSAQNGFSKPPASVSARLGLPVSGGPGKLALKSGGISISAANTSTVSGRAKAASFMGGDEDDEEVAAAQPAMFKPDEGTTEEAAADPAADASDDESDDEDLVGADEGDERAAAEERRERAMLEQAGLAEAEAARGNDPDNKHADDVDMAEASVTAVTDVEAEAEASKASSKSKKPTAMDVDPAPAQTGAQEEDEEIDPLDAYMSEVQQEAKKIDLADLSRGINTADVPKNKAVKLSAADVEGVIEDDEDGKAGEQELDPMNMTTAEIMAAAAKKAKKKELAAVDHSKISYESFRKAFYHPPREIEDLSDEEADLLRLQLDGIKIRGVDCPKPVTKWSYCGLPAVVLDVIKSLNYAAPTSIQTQAIPAIMSGRDVIGVAKTGSGKTIAFLLPLFRHIKDQRPLEPLEGPIAMIMTPTRELATQIYKECKPFLKVLNLRATCLYGGSPLKDNIAELKRGVEIVVCTPGRMLELLSTNSGKIISMRRITYLVLDEADRMFDLGFEPQVTKIIQQVRPDRQTVLFSATFPKQMEALARKILKKPLEITVGGRSVVAAEIEQVVEVREEDTKFVRLLEILGRYSNEDPDALVLIFVDRHESADDLLKELMGHHYVCQSLHGGKEQVDRDQTLADFKAGVVPIVIATSVAARGLDVKQLKLVINFDAPNHMEDYVHRAGRTGRAGNKGTCITFITPQQEKYSVDLYRALEASGVPPPAPLKEMADAFLDKVKSGKAGMAGSGFGGKGLDRFEKDREATRKAERNVYGGGTEEEAKAEGKDEDGDGPAASSSSNAASSAKQPVAELKVEIKRGPAPDMSRSGLSSLPDKHRDREADKEREKDREAAAAEAIAKAEKEAIKSGKPLDPLEKIKLVQASLNASLRQRRMEHNLNYDEARMEPSGADYHAIIPINDYPQKARWRVTNKETMVALNEATGASVTNKGIYYPPGRDPEEGDPPKLQLLIESNEEGKVKMAITEIKRILLESTTQVFEAESRASISGRFTL